MERILVSGGRALRGRVRIGGAKNAALPLMAASLLTDETLTLSNLPHLGDIATLASLLGHLGVEMSFEAATGAAASAGRVMALRATDIAGTEAPYDIVRKMRASILVLGPLLARRGQATVSLPGGCAIGTRPVDLHLKGFERLGAEIELREGYVHARAPRGLAGARIAFPSVSVGATENLLAASCLARGETVLENAAREPEVADFARCLRAMGAEIEGIGTSRLTIRGVEALHGATYRILPDRIESGTYAIAAAISGGDIELVDTRLDVLESVVETLSRIGVGVAATADGLRVTGADLDLDGIDVTTQPYPGFPTDMQAQLMALLCTARGPSTITEAIFENRFMHVPELCRMGADIALRGTSAVVTGVGRLKGAPVMATDLRASVSLVLAGLAAEGETVVNRVYHLDRGYEHLVEKLAGLGAKISREPV